VLRFCLVKNGSRVSGFALDDETLAFTDIRDERRERDALLVNEETVRGGAQVAANKRAWSCPANLIFTP
jgi:hypothetical protein